MAKDPYYRVWNGDSISASEIQGLIEGWQSPCPILEDTEWEEPERIDGWAAGAFHFIVPYEKLLSYMTHKTKRLIGNRQSGKE